MVGSVASAEPEALREATEEPVALTGSGEAVPATLVEVPLAPPFVTVVPVGNAALAAVTVVQVLSFPRPEQVTTGGGRARFGTAGTRRGWSGTFGLPSGPLLL
jgi:hypothetical protein